jgi:hypothetical protein
MFFLFGPRGGQRWRLFLAARVLLLVVFLVAVFAFHAHGTTLAVLQVARVGLLVVLLGSGWAARRRRRGSTVGRAD